MNPSTQEILESFEDLPTDKVILLPNNKNIVLAAKQAAELTVKQVTVIPSVSVPQGIAAMFAWEAAGEYKQVGESMAAALEDVQTAEITTATRSVEIDGVTCETGQVIGLLNGKLACSGDTLEQVLLETLETADANSGELITLYYGADLSAMDANQLGDRIRETYPEQELEVHEGGQPHYQLILSIE
jgi:dihydroxyacetone kinase-like predicted kinase